jgi:hypothetical protein
LRCRFGKQDATVCAYNPLPFRHYLHNRFANDDL